MIEDFGGYKIIKKIGVGGMATVYTALQKSLNRTVVLKTMHEHLQEDKTFVARFAREAKAAAAMSHENIVQIIDYGQAEETWYIAMEYIGGWDLKKWLEQHGSPPVEIGTQILYDLCAGLDHAHQHHVIHRDIKPANIMLAPTGVPKIADFGLAKQTQESTVLTVHDTMIGTVPYMSPEHATGQHVDERSDIFSLGVVAYELFGGRRPFPGNSSASVIQAIITLDPLPLNNLNPLVTDELHGVVSKMLQKDPCKRYRSANAVRRDLELIIDAWGIARGRDLVADYLTDPEKVGENIGKKKFREHVNRGYQYKSMGLGKIDDAIKEFERAHYLEPENHEVTRNLEELKAEQPGGSSSRGGGKRKKTGRRKGLLRAGAAAAVLIAACAGAWFLFGGGNPPGVPGGAATTPDEGRGSGRARSVPITRRGESRPLLARNAAAAVLETSGVDSKAARDSGAVSRETKPAAEEPAAAAVPPSRQIGPPDASAGVLTANGTLEITARPAGTFLVDGKTVAENVSVVSLSFPPGTYSVRLENSFYDSKEWESVEVASNRTVTLTHDFTKNARGAYLTVTTNRIPARIWIDGAPTEKWTPQRRIAIAPGWHHVTVKKEDFHVREGSVEAAFHDGDTVELSFTLSESD